MINPVLKITDLKKTYNETSSYLVKVLDGISLDIEEGEFVTIVGSNGTGKSTLFKAITGQVKLTGGDILLEGKSLISMKEENISKYISQVKQQPNDNLVLSLTLFENLYLAKLKSSTATLRSNKILLRKEFTKMLADLGLGLEKRLDDLVSLFSGGQKQAIALIMATINSFA